jgi:hypothetical protein
VGVAATGVLVVRAERRHHDYTPEEIHERLRARAKEVFGGEPVDGSAIVDEASVTEPFEAAVEQDLPESDVDAGSLGGDGGDGGDGGEEQVAASRLVRARRRVAADVSRVRTRLGLRPRPTRRRRPARARS